MSERFSSHSKKRATVIHFVCIELRCKTRLRTLSQVLDFRVPGRAAVDLVPGLAPRAAGARLRAAGRARFPPVVGASERNLAVVAHAGQISGKCLDMRRPICLG